MRTAIPIYCLACGATRTFDQHRKYYPVRPNEALACLRCGGEAFTSTKTFAPTPSEGFLVTPFDRGYLRGLRIRA